MRQIVLAAALLGAAPLAAASPPAPPTVAANAALAGQLDWTDRRDFDFAARGLIARPSEPTVVNAAGAVVRDFRQDAQFTGPAPDTVNPSLWRNATLVAQAGLFEVVPGIWQVRGFDISNMTVIAGKTGYILVDPLTTAEVAAAALKLVRKTLGDKPVTGVIYTHSHGDHFGGARGVIDEADVRSGKIPVYAPDGFMEHAIAENVIAGNAMSRRAEYMFGVLLGRSPEGIVSGGLGPVLAQGTVTLIPPSHTIKTTGETAVIDGVAFEFQMAPNSEAPAEMNFYLPAFKALCMAETANASMHNVLTPRGALVRDSKVWAGYLTEALRRYGDKTEVLFISHFWPRWGGAEIRDYLGLHRDAYEYLHDQSVRLMNTGLTGPEIAEALVLPPVLARAWFNRGNYGSYKFNARAVYQRYLGFFDGNPANLDPLPRADAARRYVEAMGGPAKVLALARAAHAKGDYRWEATLLSHLVYADPTAKSSRDALAGAYDQLAWQAESAPQRNFYLTGAKELREGVVIAPPRTDSSEIAANLPLGSILDSMAVRVVPERALGAPFTLRIAFPDSGEAELITVRNGVMIHEAGVEAPADATVTVARRAFLGLLAGKAKAPELVQAGTLKIAGDPAAVARFVGLFEAPPRTFPIATEAPSAPPPAPATGAAGPKTGAP